MPRPPPETSGAAAGAEPSGRPRDWLALSAAPGVGPRTFSRLVAELGGVAQVLGASAARLAQLGLRAETIAAIRHPDTALIERALAWTEQPDAHLLRLADPDYPAALAQIPDPPPLLFVRGDVKLLGEPQIAIVGSRNPTPGGCEITAELARRLAGYGLVVTSGLAIGVDGVAHQAALEAGRTIAVLGTGPDLVYPAAHRELARRIAQSGALVTELPPGQGPAPGNFPRRNRIISGLCLGVVVTEAALKSGSLITARTALEQGREVFAVPGSVRSPLARGCHALIREGAKLIESAEEILAELAPLLQPLLAEPTRRTEVRPEPGAGELADERQRLLDCMGFDPVAPDELVERTGWAADCISSMLLLMELDGHVSSIPGGRYLRGRIAR